MQGAGCRVQGLRCKTPGQGLGGNAGGGGAGERRRRRRNLERRSERNSRWGKKEREKKRRETQGGDVDLGKVSPGWPYKKVRVSLWLGEVVLVGDTPLCPYEIAYRRVLRSRVGNYLGKVMVGMRAGVEAGDRRKRRRTLERRSERNSRWGRELLLLSSWKEGGKKEREKIKGGTCTWARSAVPPLCPYGIAYRRVVDLGKVSQTLQ